MGSPACRRDLAHRTRTCVWYAWGVIPTAPRKTRHRWKALRPANRARASRVTFSFSCSSRYARLGRTALRSGPGDLGARGGAAWRPTSSTRASARYASRSSLLDSGCSESLWKRRRHAATSLREGDEELLVRVRAEGELAEGGPEKLQAAEVVRPPYPGAVGLLGVRGGAGGSGHGISLARAILYKT